MPIKTKQPSNGQPHWLDKAKPEYAPANGLWRVRKTRKGHSYNWWLRAGKGDPSSTGLILAMAEWAETKRGIIADESGITQHLGTQKDGTFKVLSDDIFTENGEVNDGTHADTYDSKKEYNRVLRRQVHREEYTSSPFADQMSLDEYIEWLDFKEARRNRVSVLGDGEKGRPTVAAGPVLFTNLLDGFEASLKLAQEGKASGLDDGDGIGKSRLEQYQYSITHMKQVVGDTVCERLAPFAISELQLEEVLKEYRNHCKREVVEYRKKAKRGRGEHWFNEKMKAARKLTTFLTQNRLCNGLPAGIEKVTKKVKVKAKAHPIPLGVLRAIWAVADDKFKTYMLLAVNLGFRQTEISLLDWDEQHVRVESGKVIVDKDRGKTGVAIKIPLWEITQEYIKQHAKPQGRFFEFEGEAEKAAIDCIGHRWRKLTRKAAKAQPEAVKYRFEDLRDTGASYLQTENSRLVPMYLGQTTKGDAAMYIGEVKDEDGNAIIPMFLDKALENFYAYLKLP